MYGLMRIWYIDAPGRVSCDQMVCLTSPISFITLLQPLLVAAVTSRRDHADMISCLCRLDTKGESGYRCVSALRVFVGCVAVRLYSCTIVGLCCGYGRLGIRYGTATPCNARERISKENLPPSRRAVRRTVNAQKYATPPAPRTQERRRWSPR